MVYVRIWTKQMQVSCKHMQTLMQTRCCRRRAAPCCRRHDARPRSLRNRWRERCAHTRVEMDIIPHIGRAHFAEMTRIPNNTAHTNTRLPQPCRHCCYSQSRTTSYFASMRTTFVADGILLRMASSFAAVRSAAADADPATDGGMSLGEGGGGAGRAGRGEWASAWCAAARVLRSEARAEWWPR